jgi:hypothetical protein
MRTMHWIPLFSLPGLWPFWFGQAARPLPSGSRFAISMSMQCLPHACLDKSIADNLCSYVYTNFIRFRLSDCLHQTLTAFPRNPSMTKCKQVCDFQINAVFIVCSPLIKRSQTIWSLGLWMQHAHCRQCRHTSTTVTNRHSCTMLSTCPSAFRNHVYVKVWLFNADAVNIMTHSAQVLQTHCFTYSL